MQNQKFNYTWMRLIQHEDSCVAPTDAKGTLGLQPCDKGNNSLKWLHKSLVAFHPKLVSTTFANGCFPLTVAKLEMVQNKGALEVIYNCMAMADTFHLSKGRVCTSIIHKHITKSRGVTTENFNTQLIFSLEVL